MLATGSRLGEPPMGFCRDGYTDPLEWEAARHAADLQEIDERNARQAEQKKKKEEEDAKRDAMKAAREKKEEEEKAQRDAMKAEQEKKAAKEKAERAAMDEEEANLARQRRIFQKNEAKRARRRATLDTSIFEMLIVDDNIRDALIKQPKLEVLRKVAKKSGSRTLQEEGILLVAQGITSLAELQRVLKL